MAYRRLFIMRKDLNMSAGKLAAQVGHCCEAYWTNMIRNAKGNDVTNTAIPETNAVNVDIKIHIPHSIYSEYVLGIFTKTICEAKNLSKLLKAKTIAEELGLKEGVDFGLINDKCLTDLKAENPDGTTTTGIWFRPLPDDIAHTISKHYQLYKG